MKPKDKPPTPDELEPLRAAWRRFGVNLSGAPSTETIDLERLILATAAVAGADERLTICAVSWLACYHDLVDGRRLSELARNESATVRAQLGLMLSLAIEAPEGAGRAPQFAAALRQCRAHKPARALYDNIEAMPRLREWVRAHTAPLFRRWGLWHEDLKLKKESIHPLTRLLTIPELRVRALCGPSIEATLVARTMNRVTNARALSREVGVSYAAAHAAVERLVGRGLMVRERNGVRQELSLSPFAVEALKA